MFRAKFADGPIVNAVSVKLDGYAHLDHDELGPLRRLPVRATWPNGTTTARGECFITLRWIGTSWKYTGK